MYHIKIERKHKNKKIEVDIQYTDYFSITGSYYEKEPGKKERMPLISSGCIYDEIAKHFPELKPFIKWHLFNKDTGPIHYIENTIYFAKNGKHNKMPDIKSVRKYAM
jgi:hypothetical protein